MEEDYQKRLEISTINAMMLYHQMARMNIWIGKGLT